MSSSKEKTKKVVKKPVKKKPPKKKTDELFDEEVDNEEDSEYSDMENDLNNDDVNIVEEDANPVEDEDDDDDFDIRDDDPVPTTKDKKPDQEDHDHDDEETDDEEDDEIIDKQNEQSVLLKNQRAVKVVKLRKKEDFISLNILSRFEHAAMLCNRAAHLENGAPPFVDTSDQTNELDIAMKEFREGKIPFMTARQVGTKMEWHSASEMQLNAHILNILKDI